MTKIAYTCATSRSPQGHRPVFATLAHAFVVARQRRHLARLDQARLSDIGLTRDEAHRESRRPLWDAPKYWKR